MGKKDLIWIVGVMLASGCARIDLKQVSEQYYNGSANKAYEISKNGANLEENFKGKKATGDELLWQIQGGIAGFNIGSPDARGLLEMAERNINFNETKGILSDIFENFNAILLNDTYMDYKGFLYEGVMVNYYKALLYMSEGDNNNARVEFNRASDRQRRIKEYYQKEIAKAQGKEHELYASKENKGNPLKQKKQSEIILKNYSNLSNFSLLYGYINPVVSYVSGVFFMLEGDYAKAIDFLKESYAITQNEIIKEDFEHAQSGGYKEKYTWIIIEDGKSPIKVERKFFIPIYTGSTLLSIGIALPDLKEGVEFSHDYEGKGEKNYKAQKISTLQPIIYNEFNQHIAFIVSRSILSTTTKALIEYSTQKATQNNALLNLFTLFGGLAYSALTTQADLRISTFMPNSFFVLKIKNIEGEYGIFANNRKIAQINFSQKCDNKEFLCPDQNHIFYIRNAQKNIFKRVLYSK